MNTTGSSTSVEAGTSSEASTSGTGSPLRASVVWFMAFAAAVGTASMYPLQPAIAQMAGALHSSVAATGAALACGPLGYLVGLAMLVPLVDRYAPRSVISVQCGVLALALAATAATGTAWLAALTVGAVGAGSSVGAQLSSVATRFAGERRRATVLGIVTSGISAGILSGRLAGGALTDAVGWRWMLVTFAGACIIISAGARQVLPAAQGGTARGCLSTVRGIPRLYAAHPALRGAAARGVLWFFAFCTVWAGLAVALSAPPFSYTPARIGLYALAGLLGIVAARVSGACTERFGARRVILTGLVLALGSAVLLGVCLPEPPVTLVCLGMFDAGLFAAQVANQSIVLGIEPAAPARFNSAYMLVYFIGGSIGTAFGSAAVTWFGWTATVTLAAGAITLAAGATAATLARTHLAQARV